VLTVDFFPPVVDDPEMYGAIAASNALSDCYAMGGKPLTALCVAGFPDELDRGIVAAILRGGFAKVAEAGAVVPGGHTVRHSEPMFGFAITGEVDPARMLTNAGAKPGDALYLTKPLGCGAITTGIKREKTSPAHARAAMDSMATLNARAAEAAVEAGASASTDVTGFGLLGHAANVARASGVTLAFDAARLPILDGARELAAKGVLSGGAARSRKALGDEAEYGVGVAPEIVSIALDAETSGGLLLSIPAARGAALEKALASRKVPVARVGEVEKKGRFVVRLRG